MSLLSFSSVRVCDPNEEGMLPSHRISRNPVRNMNRNYRYIFVAMNHCGWGVFVTLSIAYTD